MLGKMTQLERILHYIKKMDCENLYYTLPVNLERGKAGKELFLCKIEELFNELRINGNETLLINDNTCNCDKCQNLEFNKKKFTFYGNKTYDYFSLMMVVENSKVLMIYRGDMHHTGKGIKLNNELIEFTELNKSGKFLYYQI